MSERLDRVVRKLERFAPLSAEEKSAVLAAISSERMFSPRDDLIHERRPTEGAFVILDGFVCRYKLLSDGRRQIIGMLLPGDLCDLRLFLLKRMDHSVSALTPVRAALIPTPALIQLIDHFPHLTRALWWSTVVEDSITREWVVNVGCRTAFQRVAHLFCEIFWRLEAVGLARDNRCRMPLTQIELGDTLALSSVHVNRTLMYMRRANLLRLQGGELELLNREELELAAGFDPAYLHLDGGNPAVTRLAASN